MNKVFRVVSREVLSTNIVHPLSRLQRLVCRLFKITPKLEYHYQVKVVLDEIYPANGINDILAFDNGDDWVVIGVNKNILKLASYSPAPCLKLVAGCTFITIASCYSEVSGNPV